MAKLIRIVQPNVYDVENLYTRQVERLLIAGTTFVPYKNMSMGLILSKYIDQPSGYMTIISYGYNRDGYVVGDIKALDRIGQLSYDLIAGGVCKWYPTFDPCDDLAKHCSKWAQAKHNGVYR